LGELAQKRGRGTELVSLYVPPGRALHEVITNLREEYGTAANIKSDTTRNHVQDAIKRTMERLKLYRATPENGLVIFAGALPTNGPGSEVVEVHEIFPPRAIATYLYRCDDHFHLEPLREMLKEEKAIGIIAIDATEAGIGYVSGVRAEVTDVVTSGVSGKTRAGGQSARRYERMREMELTDYYHRVARHAKQAFIEERPVQGVIVSGPGPTKDDFLKGDFLDYRLRDHVIATPDISYAGREGVRETLERAGKILDEFRVVEERKLVQRFLREINSDRGLATHGLQNVLDALARASVDTVLVSEDLGQIRLHLTCKQCGTEKEKTVLKTNVIAEKQQMLGTACTKCRGTDYVAREEDVIEFLSDEAAATNARVEVISSKSEEGAMLKSFDGLAAILRFK
jgi:peptide chain release factor subunit 1